MRDAKERSSWLSNSSDLVNGGAIQAVKEDSGNWGREVVSSDLKMLNFRHLHGI